MDIYEVVKPFYVLSRIVGFSWFALPSSKWKLPKFADATLMIANVSLQLYSLYCALDTPYWASTAPVPEPNIRALVNKLFLVSSPIAWLFFIALGICRRKQNLRILSDIAKFDKYFAKPIRHVRHRRLLWIYTFLILIIVPLATAASYLSCKDLCLEDAPLPVLIFSAVSTILYEVSISHILLSAWAVLNRMRSMNESFEEDCKKYQMLNLQRMPPLHLSNVGHYRTLFEYLHNVIEGVNLCYAWVGFFCITICFLGVMATLFFTYEMLFTVNSFFVTDFFWLLMFNSYVVTIVNINEKLRQEVIILVCESEWVSNQSIEDA